MKKIKSEYYRNKDKEYGYLKQEVINVEKTVTFEEFFVDFVGGSNELELVENDDYARLASALNSRHFVRFLINGEERSEIFPIYVFYDSDEDWYVTFAIESNGSLVIYKLKNKTL